MKIIAESGSTKTTWVFINDSKVIKTENTLGYNPYYYDIEILTSIIENEILPNVVSKEIVDIYYYGSGCSTEHNCNKVRNAFRQFFNSSFITVNHDLSGAATALLGNNKGIACILGTGSNACLWDGCNIIKNVPSVGYLLGDEGSGTYLGKKILKGILEEKAPSEIIESYYSEYRTGFEDVMKRIYGSQQPNRIFSDLSKFAGKHSDNLWIIDQVKTSFEDFIHNHIEYYDGYRELEICFTGSVAYYYRDILREVFKNNNLKTGKILKEPIEGLISYHLT